MAKLIDDMNASKVEKKGTWDILSRDSPDVLNTTLSYPQTVGDSMQVTFNGNTGSGSFIVVYGYFDYESVGVVTNYSIDGAPPAQVTTPAAQFPAPLTGGASGQQFWIKEGLGDGPHTLNITIHKLNTDYSSYSSYDYPNGGPVWFDYFHVDYSNTDVPDATPAARQSSNKQSSKSPTGVIVGIVIGALFVLLGALGTLLMWRRQKRSLSTNLRHKHKPTAEESSIEPFTFDPNLFVRGPPAVTSGKSTLVRMQEETSSSSVTINSNGLPPGARPPIVPISKPAVPSMRGLSGRLSTIHLVASTDATPTPDFDPHAARADTSHLTNVPPAADSEGNVAALGPVTRQHVGRNVRSAGGILARSARRNRVELPPVYSPL